MLEGVSSYIHMYVSAAMRKGEEEEEEKAPTLELSVIRFCVYVCVRVDYMKL